MRWAVLKRAVFGSVREGNLNEVIRLIEEYPKALHASNHPSGETLIHVAAQYNHIDILEYLVEKGLPLDCTLNHEGLIWETPLHYAAMSRAYEVVNWLLDQGADINAGHKSKYSQSTPLIKAAAWGDLEMVKLFVDRGANIHASYEIGEGKDTMVVNAVKKAQMEGYPEIADYLYKQGATDPIDPYEEERQLPDEVFLLRHIEQQIGTIGDTISEVVPVSEVSIQVHIISPTLEHQEVTLVTTGMSDQPMGEDVIEYELEHAELMFALPSTWPTSKEKLAEDQYRWPIDWIRQIAHLPFLYDGWIEEGVIIPNGEPPITFSENVPFSSLLVLRPEDRSLSNFKPGYKEINFYYLIPLYEEERQLAVEKGEGYLLEKLRSQVSNLHVMNPKRINVGGI
ncbi:suppressor of fused domain protein [Priestia endophytica]|uniref:suppressor of fused domain protein n=1 Tax=Priestia endophytica TaxID=135735 RepID=UPI002282F0C9|nr:suppressor of fused domain protein [Priestia endophytica]MCY8232250.1 suppressor of fused domain protein [Priestia endophytica]